MLDGGGFLVFSQSELQMIKFVEMTDAANVLLI